MINSHTKHLKIIIRWHGVVLNLIHDDLLRFRASVSENWWFIDYCQPNCFTQ
jgi:hypothetical protein